MQHGAEVTWGKRTRPISSISKPFVPQDYESPPIKKFVETPKEAQSNSPRGLFKFLLGYEKLGVSTPVKDDIAQVIVVDQDIASTTEQLETLSDHKNETAVEVDKQTKSKSNNSTNYKELLADSEDIIFMQCAQKLEQEMSWLVQPLKKSVASKGMVDAFSDTHHDGKFLFLHIL